MISGYICLVGVYHQYDQLQPSLYQTVTFIGMGLHAYWNPPYFARQALEANVVDTVNRFSLKGSTDRQLQTKLDTVRQLSGLTLKAAEKLGISPAQQEKRKKEKAKAKAKAKGEGKTDEKPKKS